MMFWIFLPFVAFVLTKRVKQLKKALVLKDAFSIKVEVALLLITSGISIFILFSEQILDRIL